MRTTLLALLPLCALAGPAATAIPAAGPIPLGGSNTVGATCPDLLGLPLTAPDDPYYRDIAAAPAHPRSAAILRLMVTGGSGEPWPDYLTALLHPTHYGFPIVVVPGTQPLVPVAYDPQYGFPQFGVARAPIPDSFPLEGADAAGSPTPAGYPNDQHGIIVVRDEATGGIKEIYELYSVHKPTPDSPWTVSRMAWKYPGDSLYSDRPEGLPTTTAGGTRILPGLITYDDVYTRGVIDHALRMTILALGPAITGVARTAARGDADRAPQGTRLRLSASLDISTFSPACQVILRALQRYGAIIDDTGPNFQLQGTRDARWEPYEFNTELSRLRAADFEVLDFRSGYRLKLPASLSGPAGVPSGTFTVALADPTANVGTGGGPVAGLAPHDLLADGTAGGGTFTPYRVSLTTAAPTGSLRYAPAGPPGPRTIVWVDNTTGRLVPAPTLYTVPRKGQAE